MEPIVCTYIIEDTGFSEAEGLSLSASMGAYWLALNRKDLLVDEWLNSGYRKHMRRAKSSVFEKLMGEHRFTVLSGPTTRIAALQLMRAEAIDKSIRRLQMSNFSLSEAVKTPLLQALVEIVVNSELAMSFGKASVAAAHASQNLALELEILNPAFLDIWQRQGYTSRASYGLIEERNTLNSFVRDSGLTEVPEGSITAQAFISESTT